MGDNDLIKALEVAWKLICRADERKAEPSFKKIKMKNFYLDMENESDADSLFSLTMWQTAMVGIEQQAATSKGKTLESNTKLLRAAVELQSDVWDSNKMEARGTKFK